MTFPMRSFMIVSPSVPIVLLQINGPWSLQRVAFWWIRLKEAEDVLVVGRFQYRSDLQGLTDCC
jgi:hypothetical protein